MGIFYTYESMVGLWDPEWIQGSLNVLIGLFWWYRLMYNVANSKSMKC